MPSLFYSILVTAQQRLLKSKEQKRITINSITDDVPRYCREPIVPKFISVNRGNDIAVIVDNTPGIFKYQFSKDDVPQIVFSLIVNRYIWVEMIGIGHKYSYIGEEVQVLLILTYIIEHSIVTNWDGMEKVIDGWLIAMLVSCIFSI